MIDNIYTQNSTKNLRQNWTKSDMQVNDRQIDTSVKIKLNELKVKFMN